MDKEHVKKMAQMPLDDDDAQPDNFSANNGSGAKPEKQASTGKAFFTRGLKGAFTFFLMFFATPIFAQSTGDNSYTIFYFLVGAVIVVFLLVLVAIYYLIVLQKLLVKEQKKKAEEAGIEFVPEPSLWQQITSEATDLVPLEEEESIILAHEYDGIRELDNHLPPWWKWLFYVTIIWGVVYFIAYHVIDVLPLPAEEYANEVAAAEAAASVRLVAAEESGTLVDESTVVLVTDAAALADGEKIYQTNCSPCHKPDGGGSIGPNMTDEYWLHGGGIKEIFTTVKYGVVEKGMIPWEPVLTPVQMQNVSSYILTLQGTNPPGAKEAQGEIWVEE